MREYLDRLGKALWLLSDKHILGWPKVQKILWKSQNELFVHPSRKSSKWKKKNKQIIISFRIIKILSRGEIPIIVY